MAAEHKKQHLVDLERFKEGLTRSDYYVLNEMRKQYKLIGKQFPVFRDPTKPATNMFAQFVKSYYRPGLSFTENAAALKQEWESNKQVGFVNVELFGEAFGGIFASKARGGAISRGFGLDD